MKFEVMLSILFELLNKRCVKAQYLAEKYEVSVRSIYRYITSLELAGVPIYTIRGNRGGFAIIDTYKLSSSYMTVKELEQIINALSAICHEVPNKTLEGALLKLKSSSKISYSGFDIKRGDLIIDAGPWGDTVGYKNKLKIFHTCIENNLLLEIEYHDRNGEKTTRIIEPHIIVFKQGIWYIYAFCRLRDEFRFFKTGRIQSAKILDEKFTKREINNDELPLDFWHNNTKSEYVEMEISKKYLSDVEEWLGIENVIEENGKHIARAYLPFDDGLVSKIISFGSGIKIIEPIKLKERIIECVNEIKENYK